MRLDLNDKVFPDKTVAELIYDLLTTDPGFAAKVEEHSDDDGLVGINVVSEIEVSMELVKRVVALKKLAQIIVSTNEARAVVKKAMTADKAT